MPVIGKVRLRCEVDTKFVDIKFIIVNLECQTILGLDTKQKMELVKRICLTIHESVLKKHKEVFTGLPT